MTPQGLRRAGVALAILALGGLGVAPAIASASAPSSATPNPPIGAWLYPAVAAVVLPLLIVIAVLLILLTARRRRFVDDVYHPMPLALELLLAGDGPVSGRRAHWLVPRSDPSVSLGAQPVVPRVHAVTLGGRLPEPASSSG